MGFQGPCACILHSDEVCASQSIYSEQEFARLSV